VLAGISCLSAAILIVELALTRIFSVTMYYHFAFLAVSIAMFGLGASSVFVYITPRWHPRERAVANMARYATLFWIVTVFAGVVLLRVRVGLEYSSGSVARLLAVYLVAAMPFAAGGAGLAVAVSRLHHDIGRVYASDLGGAACGCLLLIPALNVFGGPGALLFASGLAALAALLFARAGEGRRGATAIVPLAVFAIALGVQVWHPWLDVHEAKGREAERPIFSKWNSFSRIAVIDREHQDWGLSDTYAGPHVRSLYMDIDSSASTPILEGGPLDGPISYLQYEITGLAYALRPPERVLVIGPGGGRDLWTALVGGARRVEGVEVNPIIVNDVMASRFKVFSGDVYHAPGVSVVVDDGRSYVSRSRGKYDVIQASLVDTWAATSAGAFAMTENNLYTVEAFEAYLRHLTPDGVLTITRWYRDGLRLVSLAHAAGQRLGWSALTGRMFLARNGAVMTLILKNSPLTDDEVGKLAATCDRLKFAIVYAPVTPSHPQPPERNDYTRLITTDNTDRFYRTYFWDITPTTDDRPFFFHTLFPGQTTMKFDRTLLFGSGYETLRTVLFLSFALVSVFIVLPLAGFSPEPIGEVRRALLPVAYFACLGTGFMLVEIGLTQRFVLFLGHPVYSLTVILFTLLLGGGLGSALSRRVGGSPGATIAIVIPLVVAAGMIYATTLPPIFAAWIGLPRAVRILVSVVLLLPLGMLLGIPLPAGVRVLGGRPGLLAWAWGVNGATSIFGASGAILIAMNWGFTRVAVTGAVVYAIAFAVGLAMTRRVSVREPAAIS
jgi:SAM-dependent methyltransferase